MKYLFAVLAAALLAAPVTWAVDAPTPAPVVHDYGVIHIPLGDGGNFGVRYTSNQVVVLRKFGPVLQASPVQDITNPADETQHVWILPVKAVACGECDVEVDIMEGTNVVVVNKAHVVVDPADQGDGSN